MYKFDKTLESILLESIPNSDLVPDKLKGLSTPIVSANAELTHIEKNKRNRLEKALRAANDNCAGKSGMGERYDYALMSRLHILQQIAKYRELTEREKFDVKWGESARIRMYPNHRPSVVESDETRLLTSILQKFDAMPQMMPYNTYWADAYTITKRFGLTQDEERALVGSKAWMKQKNGWRIDRPKLKLLSAKTYAVSPNRIREEIDIYFEGEEDKDKQKCVACGGTGKSSTGRPCEPCRLRKLRSTKTK
jgi:hypothetical protein